MVNKDMVAQALGAELKSNYGLTKGTSSVSASDTGGNSLWEEFIEVEVPDGVWYLLEAGQILRLVLQDTTPSELPNDAKIRVRVFGNTVKEDGEQLGGVRQYREFSNANQYDEDEVRRIEADKDILLKPGRYIVIEVNSSTAISASDSFYEQEVHRFNK